VKIGILSDIHGNLAALQAVLAAIEPLHCVKLLCCGDIVGYGASPKECVELVRRHGMLCARGNHDDMMTNIGREDILREEVQDAIHWTRQQLSVEEREWLGGLPRVIAYAGIEATHASHVLRPEWHYVMDIPGLMGNLLFQTTLISFIGHTHVPFLGLHQRGHRPRMIMLRDLGLPRNHRCVVNVGSVGQPRDRRPEAAFVTFETRDREIAVHRVPYDIADSQRRIREAGLPDAFARRLADGR